MNHNIFRDTDPINPEFLKAVEQAVKEGFTTAYELHERLGAAGAEMIEENQFGDTTLAIDIGSEDAMRDSLEKLPYRFLVKSEELGEFELNEHLNGPRYLAVMDGLDGSSVFKEHFDEVGCNYGAMLNIYSNDNPTYDDYVVSGIMMFSNGKMFVAKKGQGLTCEDLKTGQLQICRADQMDVLNANAIVFADQSKVDPSNSLYKFFTMNGQVANKLHEHIDFIVEPYRTGSTAANIIEVATGEATLDIGATRKGNLEFAAGYGILNEAGAVMQAEGGRDLGSQRFLEFGQDDNIMVLAAANKQVAEEAWSILES